MHSRSQFQFSKFYIFPAIFGSSTVAKGLGSRERTAWGQGVVKEKKQKWPRNTWNGESSFKKCWRWAGCRSPVYSCAIGYSRLMVTMGNTLDCSASRPPCLFDQSWHHQTFHLSARRFGTLLAPAVSLQLWPSSTSIDCFHHFFNMKAASTPQGGLLPAAAISIYHLGFQPCTATFLVRAMYPCPILL